MEGTSVPASSASYMYCLEKEKLTYVFLASEVHYSQIKTDRSFELVSLGRSQRLDVSVTHDRSTYTSVSVLPLSRWY